MLNTIHKPYNLISKLQILFVILLLSGSITGDGNKVTELVLCCFSVNFAHCVIGSACSTFTVCMLSHKIYKQSEHFRTELIQEKLRGNVTILLMNLPHFITAGCIINSFVTPNNMSWFDINFIFCPILTATLNALFIVTRSNLIRIHVRDKFRTLRVFVRSLTNLQDKDYEIDSNSTVFRNVLYATTV